jgi:hypothetical protein
MDDFKIGDLVYHWTNKNKIWKLVVPNGAILYGKYKPKEKIIITIDIEEHLQIDNVSKNNGWSLFTRPLHLIEATHTTKT